MRFIILFLFCLHAPLVMARTIWSGSFVNLAKASKAVDVSANYPKKGKGKICGIEFKSGAMILHQRVWEKVAAGLKVVSINSYKVGEEVPAVIENADGPRLYYFYDDLTTAYATLRIETRDGSTLAAYFTAALGNHTDQESMIAVARECLD